MLKLLKTLLGLSRSTVSPEDLANGTVIDVRTPAEFHRGHGAESINVPLQQLEDALPRLQKLNQPLITCCRSGSRSALAARQLNKEGIRTINGGTWQSVQEQSG